MEVKRSLSCDLAVSGLGCCVVVLSPPFLGFTPRETPKESPARTSSGRGSLFVLARGSEGTFGDVACLYDRTARNGLPTPAVPERIATASRQSKWAGPALVH